MGITEVRLMTNNPDKVAALESAGIRVVERLSSVVESQESFEKYLQVKRDKMGHLTDEAESASR
jgi:GTP cyclohydrolase II